MIDNEAVRNEILNIYEKEMSEEIYYILDNDNIMIYYNKPFFKLIISDKYGVPIQNIQNKQVRAIIEDKALMELIDTFISFGTVEILNALSDLEMGEVTTVLLKEMYKELKYSRLIDINISNIEKGLQTHEYPVEYEQEGRYFVAQTAINKYFSQVYYTLFGENLTLTQLYVLKSIYENSQKIGKPKKTMYRINVEFENVKVALCNKKGEEVQSDDIVYLSSIVTALEDKSVYISSIKEKETEGEPTLLYNTTDLMIKYKNAEEVLKSLYEKGLINTYLTTSRQIKNIDKFREIMTDIALNSFNLSNLEFCELGDKYITGKNIEGIYPIKQAENMLTKEEELIFKEISKRCLEILLGNYVKTTKKVIAIVPLFTLPFEISNYKKAGYKLLEKRSTDNENFIEEGKFYKIKATGIDKVKTKSSGKFGIEKILRLLEYNGHIRIDNTGKLERKYIDSLTNRKNSILGLIENELITEEDGEISLTEKGLEVIKRFPDIVFPLSSMGKIFSELSAIHNDVELANKILPNLFKRLYAVLKQLPKDYVEVDYVNIVKRYRCPKCGARLEDRQTFIGCHLWKICDFKISKVENNHVLGENEIIEKLGK